MIILLIGSALFAYDIAIKEEAVTVTNFEECVAAGNPVAESYPEQCFHNGQRFVRDIGNELEKTDLIRVNTPRPGDTIESPLHIAGEARGYWFFEATAPVNVVDWDGKIIGEGYITATGDWMTEDLVPFEGEVSFDTSAIQGNYSNKGTLILRKDNPSGLPENDDALEFPVVFK